VWCTSSAHCGTVVAPTSLIALAKAPPCNIVSRISVGHLDFVQNICRSSLTSHVSGPIENQILAVDPRKLDGIHPRIVGMMGYKHMEPFMGYADGIGPRRAAWRMVRWLQQEVDDHPPTFAHEARDARL